MISNWIRTKNGLALNYLRKMSNKGNWYRTPRCRYQKGFPKATSEQVTLVGLLSNRGVRGFETVFNPQDVDKQTNMR